MSFLIISPRWFQNVEQTLRALVKGQQEIIKSQKRIEDALGIGKVGEIGLGVVEIRKEP